MPRTLAGTRTTAGNRNLVQGLTFDGSQNYLNLGTLGNLGSNLGSGWYLKFTIQTTSPALGVWGYYIGYPATNSGIFINFNRNFSNAHVIGVINVGIVDNNNLYLNAQTASINFYDGNVHTMELQVTPSSNTITFKYDGISQSLTYGSQQTPATFSNFSHNVILGAASDSGTIQEFFAATVANVLIGTDASHIYASYTLNEGTGTIAADGSGNGNTATLTGSPIPSWLKRSIAS